MSAAARSGSPPDGVLHFESFVGVAPHRYLELGGALVGQAIDDGERSGRLRRVQAQELREELGLLAGVGMRR
jgi:hypothetical protein